MPVKVLVRFALILFLLAASLPSYGADRWGSVAESIGQSLEKSLELYTAGRQKEARAEVSRAYFDIFEAEGMEEAIAIHISTQRKTELEMGFASIREAIASGRPVSVVRERIDELTTRLTEDARRLSSAGQNPQYGGTGTSAYQTLVNALIIILREGFEAILIISALVAYLTRTGKKDSVRYIYYGCMAAIVASVATAVLFRSVLSLGGADREALEGITMLLATAVLFYVSYWLISKMEAERWHHYIRTKVDAALGRANIFALSSAAFLAVYREGAETILFYEALYSSTKEGGAILAGFGFGVVALALVFLLVRRYSVRIPIKPFFGVTSALLYYLAFSFAGKGVMELQEAGWLPYTEVSWIPHIELFGIYPSKEGIVLQALMLLAMLVAMGYWFATKRRGEHSAGSM